MPIPKHFEDKPLYSLFDVVAAQMEDVRNIAAQIPDDLLLKREHPTYTALRRCGLNNPKIIYSLFAEENHVTTITKLWSQYANNHKYTRERTLDFCRILRDAGVYPNSNYEITNNALHIYVEKRKNWDDWLISSLRKALPITINVHIQPKTKWYAFARGKDDKEAPILNWGELQKWP